MSAIVDIQVASLARRLEERHIVFDVNDVAAEWLGCQGYDSVYGARPLKWVIQRQLDNVLATMWFLTVTYSLART